MPDIFWNYMNEHPMILVIIMCAGFLAFIVFFIWALDIASQAFHQPYYNYINVDGKKTAVANIWHSSRGGGRYRSYRFEMSDDKWVLVKDKSRFSSLKFISIILFIFLLICYIKMDQHTVQTFLGFIIFFIYLILFVLISYYIEDKRALKIFRKMLMDENRYETEV